MHNNMQFNRNIDIDCIATRGFMLNKQTVLTAVAQRIVHYCIIKGIKEVKRVKYVITKTVYKLR